MASSCPYCGAALKLKFCVVCGRQSKINKMGNVRSTARNTDVTARLEDPFAETEKPVNLSPRFKMRSNGQFTRTLSILMAFILMICAAAEAFDWFGASGLNKWFKPLMKSYHIHFPNGWPENAALALKHKVPEAAKREKPSKHRKK